MWYYSEATYKPLTGTFNSTSTGDYTYDEPTRTFWWDVPGCKRETFKLELTDRVLKVTCRTGQGFNRAVEIWLADDTDTDAITAKLEDGVLTVTCPQTVQSKPRIIPLT